MISDECSVDELRQMGNHNFQSGKLNDALQCYELAVEMFRSEPNENEDALAVHLCNRSACYLKMEYTEQAQEDAIEAVSVSKGKYPKAYFRLVRSYMVQREFSKAMTTAQIALQIPSLPQLQIDEFQKILISAKRQLETANYSDIGDQNLTSVKTLTSRKPSIREFNLGKTLGEGNFSKVVMCTHKVTNETFALKIINKAEAERLAKRQHPNVFNEIKIERRTLCERLHPTVTQISHESIITCWHAFQDYENLYFLMDFCQGGDLWSQTFHRHDEKKSMTGCHASLIPSYMYQILSGVEHLHRHGIVHRDLKPENILLDINNRPIIIDFGTAKDLCQTDLNGPEFVGTPDFMTPEAVHGEKSGTKESSFEADLWTLGAVTYQLYTGQTPFASQSPYLTFLRIANARPKRKLSLVDDDVAWDFITHLMRANPNHRLGASTYVIDENNNNNNTESKEQVVHKVKRTNQGGYSAIREHAFFRSITQPQHIRTIPSLADLSLRVCADMVYADSQNLDLLDPGDNSSHDLMRLSQHQRNRIMHTLDRMHLLRNPRVYRRFFAKRKDARLNKVRGVGRDCVGLTLEDYPRPPQQQQDDEVAPTIVKMVYLSNPLFSNIHAKGLSADESEECLKFLKECVRKVNKLRPKVLVVCGDACRSHSKVEKLLSKVNESINVVIHDGSSFFTIWLSRGTQAIFIRKQNNTGGLDGDDVEQKEWLKEELEQFNVARNNSFCFLDQDPEDLSEVMMGRLANARIQCVFGIGENLEKIFELTSKTQIEESDDESDEDDDDDKDDFEQRDMAIFRSAKAMRLITIEEDESKWQGEDINVL